MIYTQTPIPSKESYNKRFETEILVLGILPESTLRKMLLSVVPHNKLFESKIEICKFCDFEACKCV